MRQLSRDIGTRDAAVVTKDHQREQNVRDVRLAVKAAAERWRRAEIKHKKIRLLARREIADMGVDL